MEIIKAVAEIVVEFIKRAPKDSPHTAEQILDFTEKCAQVLSQFVSERQNIVQAPNTPLGPMPSAADLAQLAQKYQQSLPDGIEE